MLVATPRSAFRLGQKRILVCELREVAASEFLNREFKFYAHGRKTGTIRVEGVSTANCGGSHLYDFSYTGDEILAEQIDDGALLTDGRYEEARRSLEAV